MFAPPILDYQDQRVADNDGDDGDFESHAFQHLQISFTRPRSQSILLDFPALGGGQGDDTTELKSFCNPLVPESCCSDIIGCPTEEKKRMLRLNCPRSESRSAILQLHVDFDFRQPLQNLPHHFFQMLHFFLESAALELHFFAKPQFVSSKILLSHLDFRLPFG